MIAEPILGRDRVNRMTRAGLWADRLLLDYLDQAVARSPAQVAIIDHNSTTGTRTVLSYRQLHGHVARMARGLAGLGVAAGDVVAMQLPNWWQFAALHLACLRIGALTNPLMPIFRHRELAYMLAFAEAKVVVIPERFRGFDFSRMLGELRPELPALEHVLVIGSDGEGSFEKALPDSPREEARGAAEAVSRRARPGANDVIQILYTSGTTGAPKGVMHTSNTLLGNLAQFIECLELTAEDSVLMASPLAHQTGFMYGLMMPIVLGTKVVLHDIWSPRDALRSIEGERLAFTMASTPFLADLVRCPGVEDHDLSSLRTFVSAGAPIPRVLVEEASTRLGLFVHSGWGMTENGCVTLTRRGDPPEKVFATDGAALNGMQVRVVDAHGDAVAAGTEGRLQVRGASNFVGYLKRPQAYDTDGAGWFETGDRARMDGDGYIRIAGRDKDIIIRGGENIPVVEVEGVLYRHPSIEDVAIVAVPDARLGERACAYVTLQPGATFSLEEMAAYLEGQRMAKPYWPERLQVIAEMPRTPSGKIQKFKLRERASDPET